MATANKSAATSNKAPKGKAPKGKRPEPKAPAAQAPGTPAPKAPAQPQQYGIARRGDLPWGPNKAAVLTALLAAGATPKGQPASTKSACAAGGGLSQRHVRHYCYHAQAGGLVTVAAGGQGVGNLYALTPAGMALLAQHGITAPAQRKGRKAASPSA
jgi:hypothetical protein